MFVQLMKIFSHRDNTFGAGAKDTASLLTLLNYLQIHGRYIQNNPLTLRSNL